MNLIYYKEKRKVKGKGKEPEFAWVTNIEITKNNARKIVKAGRNRWKIENQGTEEPLFDGADSSFYETAI